MHAPDDPAGRPDPLAGRLPVTLLTGFLGSGKTTLLAQLLPQAAMRGAAVVINEVGEIGIDHDLIAYSSENISVLANGCICCTVRTDLQETLRELCGSRRAGTVPDFDRVVIETTGLADPAPVVQTLVSDSFLGAHFRLDGVITLIDAAQGAELLINEPDAVQQVALADRILLTKTDLASPAEVAALDAELTSINSSAELQHVLHGRIDAEQLIGLGLASARASSATLSFLGRRLDRLEATPPGTGGSEGAPLRRHKSGIGTLALRFDTPFDWDAFTAAMELLTRLRGPDLLRAKGIVNVEGRPVVMQCVRHIFHPPVPLNDWPSSDRSSRLVFITRHIDAAMIRGLFEAVGRIAS